MPERFVSVFVGLGSNLDDPCEQLTRALAAIDNIAQTNLLQSSPFYRSAPIGPADQNDFINAVARLETALSPQQLLQGLQAIENSQGRVRQQKWGPRTLDLDILTYAHLQMSSDELTLPHAQMHLRSFVLQPLADIAGTDFNISGLGRLDELLAACPENFLQKIDITVPLKYSGAGQR